MSSPYLEVLNKKEFDKTTFIQEVCRSTTQRGVSDIRDNVILVHQKAEQSLKNHIFQNYPMILNASNQISHIKTHLKELGENISKQKQAINSFMDTSNLLDQNSLCLDSIDNQGIKRMGNEEKRKTLTKIEELDSLLAINLIKEGGYELNSQEENYGEELWIKDPLNVLAKIHMKITEFQFDVTYQLTESVDFFDVTQDSNNLDEKNYVKVKMSEIIHDLVRIASNIFLENSSVLPLGVERKKYILKCLINLGQSVKGVELFFENSKIHFIDLLKSYNVSVDTMSYLENMTDLYFRMLSYTINEYKQIFEGLQLESYLFCWLNTTLKCYVEQVMHVIQIRCQTFHVLTKWYVLMEEVNHKNLTPLGFNMLFFIDQCIYKHVDSILNSLLYGIKKRIKDGFANESWNKPIDISVLKDLEGFDCIDPNDYKSINLNEDGKLQLSKIVCSFVKFLTFFSMESVTVNKTFELNQCIVDSHIKMLHLIYNALEVHIKDQSENIYFINSMKLLNNSLKILLSNYPELAYVENFSEIQAKLANFINQH